MKARRLVLVAMGSLILSGAALAEQGMGKGMGMGMMGSGDAKVSKADYLKQAEMRFAHMDANKDGVIDASDRQKMAEHMQDCMNMMGSMGMMGGGMGMMGRGMGGGADTNTKEHESHHPQ